MMEYFKDSYTELVENVTWTPFADAQRNMITVVVFSVLFSLFIAGVDFVFEGAISTLFKNF